MQGFKHVYTNKEKMVNNNLHIISIYFLHLTLLTILFILEIHNPGHQLEK